MNTTVGNDTSFAASLLEDGYVVAIPTETVYGLAANAFNSLAVKQIFEVKNRPDFDPLIVHVANIDAVFPLVERVPAMALALIEKFWPGPLTLILPKSKLIPSVVTSGLQSVGLRMPSHPLTLELLRQLDFPLAAPSANPFGYISPTSAQHVVDQLDGLIPYVLDGGSCEVGIESTIVAFEDDETIVVLRPGGLSLESISEVTGKMPAIRKMSEKKPDAPGMLLSHYAPRTPLVVGNIEELILQNEDKTLAVISFNKFYEEANRCEVLAPTGDVAEASRNLFATMRKMDKGGYDLILAEYLPNVGLGTAINDRLRRAAAR
jgi:L-threonylcarbamoyladenylate synthase